MYNRSSLISKFCLLLVVILSFHSGSLLAQKCFSVCDRYKNPLTATPIDNCKGTVDGFQIIKGSGGQLPCKCILNEAPLYKCVKGAWYQLCPEYECGGTCSNSQGACRPEYPKHPVTGKEIPKIGCK
ncbi:MAG: hypothetical protein LBE12_01945 [Planctomycetaceae bacterium]|jgi:hypothetical protein|nr:hypothetical protein [Planctomycetaceae bacterium]